MDKKNQASECELQHAESKERLKTITNNELRAKMKINFGRLIDVREKDEYDKSHIEGAMSIPISELKDNLDKFNKREDINVISYAGERAKKAGAILEENGFELISIVLPGMSKW